ncbi:MULTISPECIES: hypothetical protein [unclassified Corynebacterium]|uniref:hypothetical protein n=1 Tax=unclassified Corynebacterium TaxID=2624378 RepID=UPI0029CA5DC4|nr:MULTISPECIES: hypothetical protein [unclassified Corynebacterium]WPF66453.1 hypothetical protein OLX12_01635 [Corynebacterium sp. 22KM0430]WPF68943.1 hypothetical protein OLW90_01635 [Corynebacterium sp. 21KM1197]
MRNSVFGSLRAKRHGGLLVTCIVLVIALVASMSFAVVNAGKANALEDGSRVAVSAVENRAGHDQYNMIYDMDPNMPDSLPGMRVETPVGVSLFDYATGDGIVGFCIDVTRIARTGDPGTVMGWKEYSALGGNNRAPVQKSPEKRACQVVCVWGGFLRGIGRSGRGRPRPSG